MLQFSRVFQQAPKGLLKMFLANALPVPPPVVGRREAALTDAVWRRRSLRGCHYRNSSVTWAGLRRRRGLMVGVVVVAPLMSIF